MLNKLLFALLLFLTIGCLNSKGQTNTYNTYLIEQQNFEFLKSKIGSKKLASYEDIEGNAFLYKDFTTGYIKTTDGKTLKGKLRFNLYTNNVEFLKNEDVYILDYNESFAGIKLGDYSIIKLNTDVANGYFFAYIIGKYNLISKKSVRFIAEEEPKVYDTPKPSHFVNRKEKFFLLDSNSNFLEIKNIRKLKRSSNEMKKYINEYNEDNKLRAEKESLMDFFIWLNNQ